MARKIPEGLGGGGASAIKNYSIEEEKTEKTGGNGDRSGGFKPDIEPPSETVREERPDTLSEKHSYLVGYMFLATLAVLVLASHLMMFIMFFLFLYLISDFITNDVRRYIPFMPKALLFSILYVAIISLITVLTYKIIPDFIREIPNLADQLQIQAIKEFKHVDERWNLTKYVDVEEVRGAIVKATTWTLRFLMDSFSPLYKGLIHFIFALVLNLLLYHDAEKIDRVFNRKPDSLMTFLYQFTKFRVGIFYSYFKRVMGGQLIISTINTVISSVVIFSLPLPHPFVMVFVVFFCGLFPVIGNLVSNTVLITNAFVSIGMWGAGVCLILLIVIHKLEYFLNSKVIGDIVHLPMVITLASLVACEMLLGIVGIILAIPLLLYVRHEFEDIPFCSSRPSEKPACPRSVDT